MKNDDYETLLITLDSLSESGLCEQDIKMIKEGVASCKDEERGWNVFHFAAHLQSEHIIEKLVEFLKGQMLFLCYNILLIAMTKSPWEKNHIHRT